MSTLMSRQLKAYRDWADDLNEESWKKDHRDAMKVRDLEHGVRLALNLYRDLKESTEEGFYDIEFGRDVCRMYLVWYRVSEIFLTVFVRFPGYEVEGEQALRDAIKEFAEIKETIIQRKTQYESLCAGNGVPASEAIDAIRSGV